MTSDDPTPTVPERIELARVDDLRDAVHRAVACLAQGGVVGLPSETTYVLAASALQPEAVARLVALKGGDPDRPRSIAVSAPGEAADWVPGLSELGRRLTRRAWPGPVTLVFRAEVGRGLAGLLPEPVRRLVAPANRIGLRLPGHGVVRDILRRTPGPLIVAGAPASEGIDPTRPESLASLAGLEMLLDDGPGEPGGSTTAVEVDGDAWRLLRPGPVTESDLARLGGTVILFVCTGNTCRSPMAEALCKLKLASRMGCVFDRLEERGVIVISAGLAAGQGSRAAGDAMAVVKDRGGSLAGHASQPVTPELIDAADWIVPMTRDHRDAILDFHPEAADRVRLLDPGGGDIPDPIGCGRDVYRRTADVIDRHLEHLLAEIGIAPAPHAN